MSRSIQCHQQLCSEIALSTYCFASHLVSSLTDERTSSHVVACFCEQPQVLDGLECVCHHLSAQAAHDRHGGVREAGKVAQVAHKLFGGHWDAVLSVTKPNAFFIRGLGWHIVRWSEYTREKTGDNFLRTSAHIECAPNASMLGGNPPTDASIASPSLSVPAHTS